MPRELTSRVARLSDAPQKAADRLAREAKRGLPTSRREAAIRLGVKQRPLLEKAERAADAALRAPTGSPSQAARRADLLQAAIQAVERAHVDAPQDDTPFRLAAEVGNTAKLAIKDAGGRVADHGHQADPVLQKLQVAYDGAQTFIHRTKVPTSLQEHLDVYAADGAKSAATGGFQKLTTRDPFQPRAGSRDTTHLDLQPGQADRYGDYAGGTSYADAIGHWLGTTSEEGDKAAESLGRLEALDQAAFASVQAAYADKVGQAHGMHRGEMAAITTFTNHDYSYMNSAASGSEKWLRSKVDAMNPVLHEADKSTLTREDIVARGDAVMAHHNARTKTDQKFAKHVLKKTGKAFVPFDPKKAGQRADLTDEERKQVVKPTSMLDKAREGDTNTYRSEGSLHTAVALNGLLKLPPYKGVVYRKEFLDEERFRAAYTETPASDPHGKPTWTAQAGTKHFAQLASTSKSRQLSRGWNVGAGKMDHHVLWEIEVLDARDITSLSSKVKELEVAILPGTTVTVGAVEHDRTFKPNYTEKTQDHTPAHYIVVKAKQQGPARSAR